VAKILGYDAEPEGDSLADLGWAEDLGFVSTI